MKQDKQLEKGKALINKILYTSGIVFLLAWSVFFMVNPNEQTMLEEDTTTVYQNRDVEVISSQEEAQITAVKKVNEAIVGVINYYQNETQGQGSGIVYKVESGATYIVTNEHVVANGDDFEIAFDNEANDRLNAVLIGSDPYTDLAILKIEDYEAETLATFGNTEDLLIGQTVMAIGNPLGLEFAGSVTSGIVSGHDRAITVTLNNSTEVWEMTVLQTDTAINPGNSGGALINLDGEVIGINSMKISSDSIEGMSFSIPTYIALPIIEDLETYGEVLRPTLGVSIINMNQIPDRFKELLNLRLDQRTGVYVDEVSVGSLAAEMGMKDKDVIIAIGDVEAEDTLTFRKELFNYSEGDKLTITVLREGNQIELTTNVMISLQD